MADERFASPCSHIPIVSRTGSCHNRQSTGQPCHLPGQRVSQSSTCGSEGLAIAIRTIVRYASCARGSPNVGQSRGPSHAISRASRDASRSLGRRQSFRQLIRVVPSILRNGAGTIQRAVIALIAFSSQSRAISSFHRVNRRVFLPHAPATGFLGRSSSERSPRAGRIHRPPGRAITRAPHDCARRRLATISSGYWVV